MGYAKKKKKENITYTHKKKSIETILGGNPDTGLTKQRVNQLL